VNLKHSTIRLRETENGEGRVVPISLRVRAIIVEQIKDKKPADLVFDVKPDSLTQAFGRARARALKKYLEDCREKGVEADDRMFEDIRLHDMRHEATSRLFEDRNFNVMEAAAVTGHKDLRQLKRYTHMIAAKLAQKMG